MLLKFRNESRFSAGEISRDFESSFSLIISGLPYFFWKISKISSGVFYSNEKHFNWLSYFSFKTVVHTQNTMFIKKGIKNRKVHKLADAE